MQRLLVSFLLTLLVSGCLSRAQPDVKHFLLQAPQLSVASLASPYTVKILPVKVAAPYADQSFIYRLDEQRYETDFYHRFLTNPGQMLTEAITAGLNQGRLFRTVLSASQVQEGDLLLEITATELYADYRYSPAAVLALQAYLSHTDQDKGNYLLSQSVNIRVPMQAKNAAAYAKAMNTALAQGLTELQEKMQENVRR